jgi:hypothetical protein
MKKIFVVLCLSSTLFSCQKESVDKAEPVDEVINPGVHFTGLSNDTVYTIDFTTEIHGKLDTNTHNKDGRMVYTISAYEKGLPSYFLVIRLLTDSTANIPVGEYYLTPDMINDDYLAYTTTKGVGRFEYKGLVSGSLQAWTGTAWPQRTDSVKITITKSQDGYLSGEFSGRFTRTEVVYGDMKMTFNGYFNDIKTEYYQ